MRKRLAMTEAGAAGALLAVALACAGLLFAQPRAVPPLELPSVSLPRGPVMAVLRADARDARSLPPGPLTTELQALFLKQGEVESHGSEDTSSYLNRRKALALRYRALATEVGEPRALHLRAWAVEQLVAALQLRLPMPRAKAVLGAMTSVLARNSLSRNGELVAPMFVVRTLYKSRWNILHGLAPDHGFARVERRAYYGWEALGSERVPLQRRIESLRTYAQTGGEQVEEALGVLLYRLGDYRQAANALQTAYRKQPSTRLRNYALGALAAAGTRD